MGRSDLAESFICWYLRREEFVDLVQLTRVLRGLTESDIRRFGTDLGESMEVTADEVDTRRAEMWIERELRRTGRIAQAGLAEAAVVSAVFRAAENAGLALPDNGPYALNLG